jgi:hypothetical protein
MAGGTQKCLPAKPLKGRWLNKTFKEWRGNVRVKGCFFAKQDNLHHAA